MIISFITPQVALDCLQNPDVENKTNFLEDKVSKKAQEVFPKNREIFPSTFEERLIRACQKGYLGYVSLCLTFPQLPKKIWNRAFLESILYGNSEILEQILRFVEIPKKVLMMGAEAAFTNNFLIEFKLVAARLEANNSLMHALFQEEVRRGKSAFIKPIIEKFGVPDEILNDSFILAVRLRNLEALNILSLYAVDPDLVLLEILEAIDRDDQSVVKTLFMVNIKAQHIEAAFLRASVLKRYDLLEFFLKRGASPEDLGKALLQAVNVADSELVAFLIDKKVQPDYLDKAFENCASIGELKLLPIFVEAYPSPMGYINALRSAIIGEHLDIIRELVQIYFYSLNQLILAQDLAFEYESSEIYDFFEMEISTRFETTLWEVNLDFVRKSSLIALDDWSKIVPKPTQVRFKNEDGFGEGLTRQFYAELAQCLAKEIICEKGLFKSFIEKGSLVQACEFFSFMLKKGFKTGRIFPELFLKILRITANSSIFSDAGIQGIYFELVKEKKDLRDKLYRFLKNPENKELMEEAGRILSGEPRNLGFEDFSSEDKRQAVKDHLIERYGYWLGVDYLRYLRQSKPFYKVLEAMIMEMSEKFFGENLADSSAVIHFANVQKKEILDLSTNQFEMAKVFLRGASRGFYKILEKENLEQLEGLPLEAIYTCKFSYTKENGAIKEKIELIKNLLKTKAQNKDLEFLKKFLLFVTGSFGLQSNLVIGIQEIEREKYPQAQTCFNILKLPRDYEQFPSELKTWQERFRYKLEFAIMETGYQLEEA
jgi:hypothetical protein